MTVQEPASTTKQQNARELPAALARKHATPQKEPASKPLKSEKSHMPSKQRPSSAKGKRKAVNLLEDDDDADFEVNFDRVIYLLTQYSILRPIPWYKDLAVPITPACVLTRRGRASEQMRSSARA